MVSEVDADAELLSITVDLPSRAVVVFATAGGLVHAKVDANAEVATAERSALTHLGNVIAVPRLVHASKNEPLVTVLEHVVGDQAGEARPADWSKVGAIIAAIHGSDPSGFALHRSHSDQIEAELARLVEDAVELGVIDREIAAVVKRKVGAATVPVIDVLIHGDAQPEHFVLGGDRVRAVLDFGDVGVGNAAHDLAVLTVWHPHRLDDVLDGYAAPSAIEEQLRSAVPAMRIFRLLDAAVWLEEEGFNPGPYRLALYEELLGA